MWRSQKSAQTTYYRAKLNSHRCYRAPRYIHSSYNTPVSLKADVHVSITSIVSFGTSLPINSAWLLPFLSCPAGRSRRSADVRLKLQYVGGCQLHIAWCREMRTVNWPTLPRISPVSPCTDGGRCASRMPHDVLMASKLNGEYVYAGKGVHRTIKHLGT